MIVNHPVAVALVASLLAMLLGALAAFLPGGDA